MLSKQQKPKKKSRIPRALAYPRKPPQLPVRSSVTRTYRYHADASTASSWYSITNRDLIGMAGAMCTVTNSTLACVFDSVKVHSIEIWSPSNSSAVKQCGIRWYNVENTEFKEVMDLSFNSTDPAHVYSKVPTDGVNACSNWLSFASSEFDVFALYLTGNEIVDVHCTHRMDDGAVNSSTRSVTTATQGLLYYTYLDFSRAVILKPIGVTSTY